MKQLRFYPTTIAILIICLIGILFSIKCNAQAYLGGSINTLGMGLNGGYKAGNFNAGIGTDFNENSKATVPLVVHANIGYDLNANGIVITPSIGYSFVDVTIDDESKNYPELKMYKPYASLSIGKDINCGYQQERKIRPYIFTSYCYKLYAGAGLRIYIK